MTIINAGAYIITTGLYRGREHVYVTHASTGKQWVSKSEHDKERPLSGNDFSLKSLIECRMIRFNPNPGRARNGSPEFSCDTRFWEPVMTPVAQPFNEFDALCFVGD